MGTADFNGVETLRLEPGRCTFVDVGQQSHDANCSWIERDGKAVLRFEETFMDKKRPVELIYLEDIGILTEEFHIDTVFYREPKR